MVFFQVAGKKVVTEFERRTDVMGYTLKQASLLVLRTDSLIDTSE